MTEVWSYYDKVHAVILDPHNRVGVMRHTHMKEWSASFTRALVNKAPEGVVRTAFLFVFDIDYTEFSISHLWQATLDEYRYEMFVIQIKPGASFFIRNNTLLRFVPFSDVVDEVLAETVEYSNDTVLVMSHLSPYLTKDSLGTFKFHNYGG